ncbi:MAG: bifunctional DNA-formamidopyrimidine glycosylase/DNA-(apurinic or apyrimidinic site) lyase [Planctomycetota bacterium]
MPELPEVETVRAGLAGLVVGRTLEQVELRRANLRWPIPRHRLLELCGRRCGAVARRSKYLQMHFDGQDPTVALIHLGMSGRLFVDRVREAPPAWQLHEHWRMSFGDRLVRYVDARRFGMLDVVRERNLGRHRLMRNLGPEPLQGAFDAAYLFRRTRGRRAALKAFLMDARNVVGIGNIYASETCFRAGLRPCHSAGRLTRADCERLARAVRSVLRDAIAQGGTTLRDYIRVDQAMGYFQGSLEVYGRDGQPCHRCGAAIRRVVSGARSTYYCPGCQR